MSSARWERWFKDGIIAPVSPLILLENWCSSSPLGIDSSPVLSLHRYFSTYLTCWRHCWNPSYSTTSSFHLACLGSISYPKANVSFNALQNIWSEVQTSIALITIKVLCLIIYTIQEHKETIEKTDFIINMARPCNYNLQQTINTMKAPMQANTYYNLQFTWQHIAQ